MPATPIRKRILLARPGRMFLGTIGFVLIAAYALSLNILYLFGAWFIGVMIYNLIVAILNIRSVELALGPQPHLFAGKPASLNLTLTNRSRLFHANHLRFSVMDTNLTAKARAFQKLAAGETCEETVTIEPPHRGWLPLDVVGLETSYPFGLVTHGKEFRLGRRLLVFPALLDNLPDQQMAVEQVKNRSARISDDFQYLDHYREGDDVRLIHWRKSTLSSQPVIRRDLSAVRESPPRLFIPDGCPHFEYAISALATYFWHTNPTEEWLVWTASGQLARADNAETMLTLLATLTPLVSAPSRDRIEALPFKPLWASSIRPDAD